MDWLKDKKNQPIVAGALAVIILGTAVAMYFLYFAGGGSTDMAAQPTQDASAGMPGASPPGGGQMAPPPGAPGAPAMPGAPATTQAAQPAGSPGAVAVAATPMEAFRADPFLPVGYKPPPRVKHKPKARIMDLPIQNWSHVVPVDPPGGEQILPQPVRRMAGLIVSDSIYAIIETNGKSEIRQPGDILDDRMAKVERIERDKVVLTMDKKPKYLIVRMASAPHRETPSSSSGSPPGERACHGYRSTPGGGPGGESPM